MALPDEIKRNIEKVIQEFCDRRVHVHVREKVRLNFKIRGNTVILFEERARWNNPKEWTISNVAQFRFESKINKWTLYCRDRNSKWHNYTRVHPMKDISDLLNEVDSDPTGIFWG